MIEKQNKIIIIIIISRLHVTTHSKHEVRSEVPFAQSSEPSDHTKCHKEIDGTAKGYHTNIYSDWILRCGLPHFASLLQIKKSRLAYTDIRRPYSALPSLQLPAMILENLELEFLRNSTHFQRPFQSSSNNEERPEFTSPNFPKHWNISWNESSVFDWRKHKVPIEIQQKIFKNQNFILNFLEEAKQLRIFHERWMPCKTAPSRDQWLTSEKETQKMGLPAPKLGIYRYPTAVPVVYKPKAVAWQDLYISQLKIKCSCASPKFRSIPSIKRLFFVAVKAIRN